MKIRKMNLKKAEEALAKARKECPGSLYERHLEQHIENLKAAASQK